MLIAFYLADMSDSPMGEFFENIEDFALNKFDIKLSEIGVVSIKLKDEIYLTSNEFKEAPISYSMRSYTREEILKDFLNTEFFKSYTKSRFYTLYKAEKLIWYGKKCKWRYYYSL